MMRRILPLCVVVGFGIVLIFTVLNDVQPFGAFPQRPLVDNQSVGQVIIENAPRATGSANVVTSVVWDYRGYDTIGEATILFTAVCSVAMLFRIVRRRE